MKALHCTMVVLLCLVSAARANAEQQEQWPPAQQQDLGSYVQRSAHDELSNKSMAVLKMDLDEAQRKLEAAESEFAHLETEKRAIVSEMTDFFSDTNQSDLDEVIKNWNAFSDTFDRFKSLGANSPERPAMLKDLRQKLIALVDTLREAVPNGPRDSFTSNSGLVAFKEYSPPAEVQQIKELNSKYLKNDSPHAQDIEALMADLNRLVGMVKEGGGIAVQVKNAIESVHKAWTDYENQLQVAINERQHSIHKLNLEKTRLTEAVAQQEEKKITTDSRLTNAILFMVGALIILYVATLFARESIQALIFQQRTLVEMIGLAFLLLTIIILGTGEKIDRSVLGALLGTVGGYIFGQQVAPRPEKLARRSKKNLKRSEKKPARTESSPARAKKRPPAPPTPAPVKLPAELAANLKRAADPDAVNTLEKNTPPPARPTRAQQSEVIPPEAHAALDENAPTQDHDGSQDEGG